MQAAAQSAPTFWDVFASQTLGLLWPKKPTAEVGVTALNRHRPPLRNSYA